MPSRLKKERGDDKRTLTGIFIGPARDVRDPQIFQHLSLIAFLAWVGLGSDGLSSSCYGPEEAFLALGPDQYLAIFLAFLMALTVFIISASYAQTIDEFPTGGGGYTVATKLLGARAGLVSGCALIVDYVLTISISIASGADAIFSFLPITWFPYRFWLSIAVVILMIGMNLRGVKESVLTLLPIFVAFVVMHVAFVTYAFISRAFELPLVVSTAVHQAHKGIDTLGALSLAFIAGGILVGYLLTGVEPQPGKTLNAVLFERLTANWNPAGFPLGAEVVALTLITEGALLFVAAQTGFVGGPQVLATMAMDRWVPRRFSYLSERLVTEDGVLTMGLAAILILIGTHARVGVLVVLYAINVFITFTLSQLGMSKLWWQERGRQANWIRKLLVNGIGCVFTALILMLTVTLKFKEGGWVTVAITGAVIAVCYSVRRHYDRVAKAIAQLEVDILPQIFAAPEKTPALFDIKAPTAVLLVSGFNGLGLATLMAIPRLFNDQFRNMVFVSVGEVDSNLLKGPEEVEHLEQQVADDLVEYRRLAADLGFHAEVRTGLGPDVIVELRRLCLEVAGEFPHSVFFAGQLVFSGELDGFVGRFLHNHTAFEMLRWLQVRGLSLLILPVRVSSRVATESRSA